MNLEELKANSVPVESENNRQEGFIPSITQEEPSPTTVSMTSGAAIKNSGNRVKADFSALPEEEIEGVVDKVSPVNEILGEGGIFEKYRSKKNAEYDIARQQANDEIESRELDGEITNDEIEPFDFEQDTEEVQVNESYKEINVVDNAKKEEKITEEKSEEDDGEYGIIDENDSDEDAEDEDTELEIKKNDIDDDEDEEDRLVLLKSIISQKIKPIKQRLDLSSYTISSKVKTTDAVVETDQIPTAKWALMSSNVVVLMKAFSGSELETLRECLEDRGEGFQDYRTVLNMIYHHIVSPKPKSFEKWVKTISFFDYEHLFFAIYIASFSGANYIPIECSNPKCKNKVRTYLTDNIPFMDMVKYKNNRIENRFKELYKSDSYDPIGLIMSEVVPLDEKTAIGFRIPSLYGALLEPSYFDDIFTKRYSSTINVLPYIDNIYEIDQTTKMLTPYGYKIYTNNIAKSTKSRVKKYHNILKNLHPDSYNLVGGIVSEINDIRTKEYITYQIPETNCPYCGTVIPAKENQSPIQMVFTRNRLGLLATM